MPQSRRSDRSSGAKRDDRPSNTRDRNDVQGDERTDSRDEPTTQPTGPDDSYAESQAKQAAAGVNPGPLSTGGGISGAINLDHHESDGENGDGDNYEDED